jgi:hypothetical protein
MSYVEVRWAYVWYEGQQMRRLGKESRGRARGVNHMIGHHTPVRDIPAPLVELLSSQSSFRKLSVRLVKETSSCCGRRRLARAAMT